MNRKQEMILWIGLIVIQLMIVFPPVVRLQGVSESVDGPPESSTATGWAPGYGVITRDYKNIRFGMLAAQVVIVAIATTALIYIFREKERKEDGH